jgi:hypothetical protein
MDSENKFTQLCVWPGTDLGDTSPTEFVEFFKENGYRVKFDSVQITNPDLDENKEPVPDTGGRSDIFFYIHDDDTARFAVPRLSMGIRWWEDVISYNKGNEHLYTKEFIDSHPVTW